MSKLLFIGMSIVISMLLLIIIILLLTLINGRSKRRAAAQSEPAAAPVPKQLAPIPVFTEADETDGQLVAVISAALAAYLTTGEFAAALPSAGFRVRRIRRLR